MWAHEDSVIQYLTIDGEVIVTTPNHPFKTGTGEWLPAGELQVGDTIYTAQGGTGIVETISFVYAPQPMYNLTVATAHTYFVGDGQWLVHNSCLDAWAKKVRLNPNSPTTQQLFNNRYLTVQEYISRFRGGRVNREMPGEALNMTVDQALRLKGKIGSKVRKLLIDNRFK